LELPVSELDPCRPLLAGFVIGILLSCDADREPATTPTGDEPAQVEQAPGANVVLVTLDTTRADRLGCYGDTSARTPTLDRISQESVVMERALCTAPITLPSHASIMTGLYPSEHGVRDNGVFQVPQSLNTLAEILKKEGYATAAFISANVLGHRYGLDQGFDCYDDGVTAVGGVRVERRAAVTVNAALAWLDSPPSEPWFVWLHLFDPHRPFRAPEEFSRDASDEYAAEISYMDHHLGRFVHRLDAEGRKQRTILMVTADHGEGLNEHRELAHGIFLYDSTMRVPWLVRFPALPARRIREQVSLVSLFPTLLELLSLPIPSGLPGPSLLASWTGQEEPQSQDVYLETQLPLHLFGVEPTEAVISSDLFKLIEAPTPELYDLNQDPGERHNLLAARQEPDLSRLRELLGTFRGHKPQATAALLPVDAEERARLEALGYVQDLEVTGPRDPKDLIQFLNLRVYAQQCLEDNRAAEAEETLRRVLENCPRDAGAWSFLAKALFLQDRTEEGLEALKTCLQYRPDEIAAAMDLARAYHRRDNLSLSLQYYEHVLEYTPGLLQGRLEAAEVYQALGNVDMARRHLEEVATRARPGSRHEKQARSRLTDLPP
jgi:arylsulfatase A-like enzyme